MSRLAIVAMLIVLATSAQANWPSLPEMDPGLASTGIAFLAGSLLVVFNRFKR